MLLREKHNYAKEKKKRHLLGLFGCAVKTVMQFWSCLTEIYPGRYTHLSPAPTEASGRKRGVQYLNSCKESVTNSLNLDKFHPIFTPRAEVYVRSKLFN